MPLRTLIDATDIDNWSVRRDAQEYLPLLLRRLIHATVNRMSRIGFPAGEAVQQGGWDGIIEVDQGNEYVPDGRSVWEMGVNNNPRGKADSDYEKRKKDPLGVDPATTSFIFVTTRRWRAKEDWIAAREAEGFWREVRAYDADDLEQWLEQAPAVHIWLSILLGKHPETAIDLMHFWEDWSQATQPALGAQLFTGGRQDEVDSLSAWLRGEPTALPLKADSRDEAITFLVATLQELPVEERVPLLSRAVIVSDGAAWNQLVASGQPLLLVPTFDAGNGVVRAVRNGHHVIVPLGRDSSETATTVVLPRLHRQPAREALLAMGIPEARADDLATLARRSLLALRRRLATIPDVQQPAWATPVEARPLLPALLAGGWQDDQAGDQEMLSRLARVPYEADMAKKRALGGGDRAAAEETADLSAAERKWHVRLAHAAGGCRRTGGQRGGGEAAGWLAEGEEGGADGPDRSQCEQPERSTGPPGGDPSLAQALEYPAAAAAG